MEDVIKNLEALGFTNYESKVLCVLFQGKSMTGSDVAREAKIPRSSAYDILKSFAGKGICNVIDTSAVARYELIDPGVVEGKIEKEINDVHKTKLSRLKESFGKLKPLFDSRKEKISRTDVELIKGFNKNREQKFMEIWKSSENELLLMNRLEGHVDTSVDDFTVSFIKKGGVIRSLYEVSGSFKINIEGTWEEVTPGKFLEVSTALGSEGGEVRFTERVYQNMAIFDRKVVYVSLVDPTIPKYNRSDIIVRNENYAQAMVQYFNECWDRAKTAEEFSKKLKI